MQIIQKFKNPLIWASEIAIKLTIKKLFFNNIENNDFKRIFIIALELMPRETFIDIIKLLINTFRSKPSELNNYKLLDEVITHSIPSDQKSNTLGKLKILFIFLIAGNVIKRTLFLVKNIILIPFKLGVYSFIASLFGFRPDYLLSFFDIYKFNLPCWTYLKLLELHNSWLDWLRNTLQIKSISSNLSELKDNNSMPKLRSINIESEVESRPETYLYLTQNQWKWLGFSLIASSLAFFGYTLGIPYVSNYIWESNGANDKESIQTFSTRPNSEIVNNQGWQDTFTNWTTKLTDTIKKPFSWFNSSPAEADTNKIEGEATRLYKIWKLEQEKTDKLWQGILKKGGESTELESNNSSPTPSDSETATDRDRYFPKHKHKVPLVQRRVSEFYSAGESSNDSTETIRPTKSSPTFAQIEEVEQDRESAGFNPFDPQHEGLTYPPRRFLNTSEIPALGGWVEDLDSSSLPPKLRRVVSAPKLEDTNKGSLLFSADWWGRSKK